MRTDEEADEEGHWNMVHVDSILFLKICTLVSTKIKKGMVILTVHDSM